MFVCRLVADVGLRLFIGWDRVAARTVWLPLLCRINTYTHFTWFCFLSMYYDDRNGVCVEMAARALASSNPTASMYTCRNPSAKSTTRALAGVHAERPSAIGLVFANDLEFANGIRYKSRELAGNPEIALDLAIADDHKNGQHPEIAADMESET